MSYFHRSKRAFSNKKHTKGRKHIQIIKLKNGTTKTIVHDATGVYNSKGYTNMINFFTGNFKVKKKLLNN